MKTLKIPTTFTARDGKKRAIIFQEADSLVEKRWRARIWLNANPYARATAARLRAHLNRVRKHTVALEPRL